MTLVLLSVLGVLAASSAPVAPAPPSCAETVFQDWTDGSIDGTYSAACYKQALDSLPEDVIVYSSAGDDITRAMRAQLARERPTAASDETAESGATRRLSGAARSPAGSERAAPEATTTLATDVSPQTRTLPLPLLLLVVLTIVLAAAASAGMLTRRLRRARGGARDA